MARFDMTPEALAALWDQGRSVAQLCSMFGCHENTIRYRLKLMGRGNRAKEVDLAPPPAPQDSPHVAAIRMPGAPTKQRDDYADLAAAIRRAKGSAVAMGQVAARFRLPYGVVMGHARKMEAEG